MKRILAAVLFALPLLPAASTADDQDVIDYRRHIMETLKAQTAAIGMIMSGAIPDDNVVAHIDIIAQTAATALKAFEPKVEGGDAKAEVWAKWDDFSARMNEFAAKTAAMSKTAHEQGKDEALLQAMDALTCKQCHDVYRVKKPAAEKWRGMRLLWIALAAFACGASAGEPPAAAERGRYVATAANCVSCHTREGGAAFSGGRALATPLGTIHSTNITPDGKTGIGSWSEQDLKRALREGIAADGRHLFPAFPYPFYTKMSDGDIADLYAFLRTLKPVRYVPPENGRAFRMRWPMATWNGLNLTVGAYRPDPARSAEWNRGAYLVQGPGHCGACHTPRDWSLAAQSSEPLRGAVMRDEVKGGGVRDWYAVDLRATAQGLGGWNTEHIVDYLGKGASARAGSFGPMNAVIANSTRLLRSEDLRAIAVYLKSLTGADYAGAQARAEGATSGAALYERNCRECHGPSGRGGIFEGPPLAGSAIVQGESAASLINIVLYGSDKPAGLGSTAWEVMPAYEQKFDDEQVAALANFLRASWSNRAPPVTPQDVAGQRRGTD